jgi:hypothetical protein
MRAVVAAAFLGSVFMFPASAADTGAIPNFTSIDSGWLLQGGTDFLPSPAGQQGPISNDPKYPHVGNNNQGLQPTERIADVADPNLKPWAAAQMKARNEEVLKGKRGFVAQSRCWPGGTPAQLLVPAEPVFFIQTPKIVYIIWQRDQNVRRIYMNQPHSANVKPSWFGESVGHYENDELVIDTIGIAEGKFSYVDNYRTPHTKDLHVVERWKLTNNGQSLEATATVEDPGTFNKPWTGVTRRNKVTRGPMIESYCAENNVNYFNLDEWPMPEAQKADF